MTFVAISVILYNFANYFLSKIQHQSNLIFSSSLLLILLFINMIALHAYFITSPSLYA